MKKVNKSTVLSCLAAIGVLATAVSVGLATPKALEIIKKKEKEKDSRIKIISSVVPIYIPSAIIGVSTIACIFSSNAFSRKQQAAISSAYALLNSSYKDYRSKLVEMYGQEVDDNVEAEMVRSRCDYHVIDPDVPDNKVIFFEPITNTEIQRYERDIIDAEYHFNRNFVLRGYASLNEFLEFLGIDKVEYGDSIGWTCTDGEYWLDFEHHLIKGENGKPDVYEIYYIFEPDVDYLREWFE